jgi:hypothetical protein
MRYIIIFVVLISVLVGAFLYVTKRNLTDQTQESANKMLMEYAPKKTKIDNASDIPQGADKYLPVRGFLFASGGLLSAPSRLAVDVDRNILSYGIGRDFKDF